jgi:hypothetical protein
LRARYREVIGLEVRTNNRAFLIRRIAHALQLRAEALAPTDAPTSPPSEPSAAPARAAARPEATERDQRLPPPGTALERHHDGKTVRVMILEDGFEYEGRRYRSLSAIAREVTGTIWNGLLFFNLVRRKPAR